VDVVAVDGGDPEVRQRPVDHRVEEGGCDAVPADDVLGIDQPRLDVRLADAGRRVRGVVVEGSEPALGGDTDGLAFDVGRLDRRADDPLGAAPTVVGRGVDEVDPRLQRPAYRPAVALVGRVGGVAEIRPDPDGGDHARPEPPELRPREGVAEPPAIVPGRVPLHARGTGPKGLKPTLAIGASAVRGAGRRRSRAITGERPTARRRTGP